MKHLHFLSVLILAGLAGTVIAQEAAVKKYDLRYNPQGELVTRQELSAKIDNVTMESNPLGIEGWMKSKLQHTATAIDAQKQTFIMTLKLDDIQQEFNGQAMKGKTETSLCLEVSPLGELVGPQGRNFDLTQLGTAGIPTELLAVMCYLVRFPDHPVAVGEEWEIAQTLQVDERCMPIPMNVTTKLDRVEHDRYIRLLSQVRVHLASFRAPNPLGYGDPVPINNGEMTISNLWRIFDLANGVVIHAEGKARFNAQVDMGGFPLNVQVDWSMALKPEPQETQQPAGTR